jgi:hypothetical protein
LCPFYFSSVQSGLLLASRFSVGEEYMVDRTISVHEDLPALAANVFELWHESLEIAGGQGEQKPIAGPIRQSVHNLKPRPDRVSSKWKRDVTRRLSRNGGSAGAQMPHTVADILVGTLEKIGVKHIFGLIGDSLNPECTEDQILQY